ncbi:hypothetical protein OSSY52_06060 [Tepiditoga spiralis]|uniref:4-hydroxy-3-methylbut-2-enyl diphosphate reductase n=1 Tax=Tepiditoga spiralis TaxID=2108365 RepID=A0A7G1G395_9BACT|nr:4-hydroxy-3-methylbut-2-enyl diphosphate reductase [Tepiditoga spiralis]BBE30465.1 hypothetical protein OSSY52_06060 [Tepiditoga spiralis]
MEIKIAKKTGFCYGVDRAFNGVKTLAKESKEKVYIYGELVHNKEVIKNLSESGIEKIDNLKEFPQKYENSTVVIRAHGIPKKEREQLKKFKKVVDMTCPIVQNLVDYTNDVQLKGYYIVVYGKTNHPEMICLKGNVDEKKINITLEPYKLNTNKICIISQTTVDNDSFKKFYMKMMEINNFSDIIIKNTICKETSFREEEAKKLSKWAECVIVIGGKNSSNTRKLYNISLEHCKNTHYVENYKELSENIKNNEKVAILTGSSTPQWSIKDVVDFLKGNIS